MTNLDRTTDDTAAELTRWFAERRLGKFTISDFFIEDEPRLARLILGSVFPVRAERFYDLDGLEYMAFGPDFEPCDRGSYAPRYEAQITRHDDAAASFKWVRL